MNYKVREYISNLLSSILKAKHDFNLEIFIVDNHSEDGSVEFLKARFPDVRYIENLENLGFSKANNQAIKQVSGKYTLIINPDTLVSEDTFSVLFKHMEANPKCGAAGCKILNPDGTFAPESKRSVPTIWSSFTKVTGLGSLFPSSKLLSEYYLNWIDENEQTKIPVLSGSFMFWRSNLLKELGGFDERFFMYGEDIDLCYRVQDTNYHIDYVPQTSIIHYKGESSKKGDLRYIRVFNKALYQFFDKHHSSRYSLVFKVFIYTAIWLKALISLFTNNVRLIGYIASDLVLLNVSVILGFLIRFQFSYEVLTNLQNLKFLWINLLASIIYVIVGGFLDLFQSKKESISNQIKAIIASYSGVALITFFAKELAFSRLALIIGLSTALVLMLLFKVIQINISKSDSKVTGKLKRLRILLVGDAEHTSGIKAKIHSRPDWNYEVVGIIGIENQEKHQLGELSQLKELIKTYQIDQVFFALSSISYKDMLRQISLLQNEHVVFKLIPDSMDFILGKSNVEYLESIPLVEVGFAYSKRVNQFLKRVLDVSIALPCWILAWTFTLPGHFFNKSEKRRIRGLEYYSPPSKNIWKNRTILFWHILKGNLSLVGSPIYSGKSNPQIKPGMTGPIQINASRISSDTDHENYELYYLQNYSIWMDIDILLKSFFSETSFSKDLKTAFS
ncbi:MAG: glycosyltransferase [Balneolaceae bacterium]|nr:glycosyltransferase [Balneolaceae bacterium]MBO6547973.1 glycosyltransferase [Balneolaceae bacterium]MBO6648486.1 glycosyltransferase [Balneolaceae bacterium]